MRYQEQMAAVGKTVSVMIMLAPISMHGISEGGGGGGGGGGGP